MFYSIKTKFTFTYLDPADASESSFVLDLADLSAETETHQVDSWRYFLVLAKERAVHLATDHSRSDSNFRRIDRHYLEKHSQPVEKCGWSWEGEIQGSSCRDLFCPATSHNRLPDSPANFRRCRTSFYHVRLRGTECHLPPGVSRPGSTLEIVSDPFRSAGLCGRTDDNRDDESADGARHQKANDQRSSAEYILHRHHDCSFHQQCYQRYYQNPKLDSLEDVTGVRNYNEADGDNDDHDDHNIHDVHDDYEDSYDRTGHLMDIYVLLTTTVLHEGRNCEYLADFDQSLDFPSTVRRSGRGIRDRQVVRNSRRSAAAPDDMNRN